MCTGREHGTERHLMTPRILFSAPPEWWPIYQPHLLRACEAEGMAPDFTTDASAPETIDYIVYRPGGPVIDFAPFTALRAVLSLWAGVEHIADNPTLTAPLCRMVDEGLTQGMVEWATGHVLRYHLGIDAHLGAQDGIWRNDLIPPLARDRRIGLLGMGTLGSAVADALSDLRFDVMGWTRREREPGRVPVRFGDEGLDEVLARSEILVTLLPATPQTENILNKRTLGLLPRGARLINPGRGHLVNDQALLDALDTGQIAHATLDVFRVEPLPADHPYWAHPRVTVTPHIASETRPETASETIALNVRRDQDGERLLYVVDRGQGY